MILRSQCCLRMFVRTGAAGSIVENSLRSTRIICSVWRQVFGRYGIQHLSNWCANKHWPCNQIQARMKVCRWTQTRRSFVKSKNKHTHTHNLYDDAFFERSTHGRCTRNIGMRSLCTGGGDKTGNALQSGSWALGTYMCKQ